MKLQIFALLGRYVRFKGSGDLVYTVADTCNRIYLEFTIHVVPASFPKTEEEEFL